MKISWKAAVFILGLVFLSAGGTVMYLQKEADAADGKVQQFETRASSPGAVTAEEPGKSGEAQEESRESKESGAVQEDSGEVQNAEEKSAESGRDSTKGEKKNTEDKHASETQSGSGNIELVSGEEIAEYAKTFVGLPYVYGQSSLWSSAESTAEEAAKNAKDLGEADIVVAHEFKEGVGVDSSGFVMAVFEHFGIKLPRSVREQAKEGSEVALRDCRPGDIIFYGVKDEKPTHCGIYIGDQKIVHASAKEGEVCISDMNYRRIVKAVYAATECVLREKP